MSIYKHNRYRLSPSTYDLCIHGFQTYLRVLGISSILWKGFETQESCWLFSKYYFYYCTGGKCHAVFTMLGMASQCRRLLINHSSFGNVQKSTEIYMQNFIMNILGQNQLVFYMYTYIKCVFVTCRILHQNLHGMRSKGNSIKYQWRCLLSHY